jgi:single-stranded DNA-binding protein
MIGYITGVVEKVIPTQYGVGLVVVESYTDRDGQLREKKPVAWFDSDPGVQIGEKVNVSGIVTAKVDEWTGNDGQVRHSAKISLSSARIEVNLNGNHAPAAPAASAPAADGWDTPASNETPF